MSKVYCPECKSLMILRTAKKGPTKGKKFWGCSNYPTCKGIVNLKDLPQTLIKKKQSPSLAMKEDVGTLKRKIKNLKNKIFLLKNSEDKFQKLNKKILINENLYNEKKEKLTEKRKLYANLNSFNTSLVTKHLIKEIEKLKTDIEKFDSWKNEIEHLSKDIRLVEQHRKDIFYLEEIVSSKKEIKESKFDNEILQSDKKFISKKEQKIRAIAARAKGEQRKLAQIVKKELWQIQIKDFGHRCPYCLVEFKNESEVNGDHIIPVEQGGLSTHENMVLICKRCNSKKRAKSLRKFCDDEEKNYDNLIKRLVDLDKYV